MLAKRIIPCLDIKDGRTVKGVNFENLRDAGDPVELGQRYTNEGADELVFLDITATHEKRKTLSELARRIAQHLNIPFTIGGGVQTVEDAGILLTAGADKISINSAAVKTPDIIEALANSFWKSVCSFSSRCKGSKRRMAGSFEWRQGSNKHQTIRLGAGSSGQRSRRNFIYFYE